MELLNIDCLGKPLRLEGSMAGWQQLFWGDDVVSVIPASTDYDGIKEHQFELSTQPSAEIQSSDGTTQSVVAQTIVVRLVTDLKWQPFHIRYQLFVNDKQINDGARNSKDIEQQIPVTPIIKQNKLSVIGLASLGFKLLKSAKVIKVVLMGASVAAYSWLFSFQFALALIACLVFHEYGHIRAMKYFGMKTKGIYLIPFMGGLALSDERINTRWQDVVISIMGPTFGLLMSLVSLVAYWITGSDFFAGLAAFNALLNLFNLLPILPLDGGHILKSISFSMNSLVGLVLCIGGAAFGVYLSYTLNLTLLGLMLLIGSVEIAFEWRARHYSHLLPLDKSGQIVSTVWYVVTVASLVGIIWYLAGTGNDMLGLPLLILQS
ncbi:Zn-dependent protease [Vibrio sp. 10N.286.49.C2]|uniref:site-2 protease family protein n=1 Tax=unclassified Vibrio TaxID=2614977 RepID=UPI000C83C6ED|nr:MULTISPECIES: site-2 protease family protein [unclassified Vibrio]PMH39337.1 Zn-dependent protease [Vibrio sp. 10N.286.49.C2]PMH54313.1 Zn-dependent protease [Vibrio sp. 10N.286.49.B1]PMH79436.1 Zn-dependent protease [Vibrio sp. 10N.286.48.B7]